MAAMKWNVKGIAIAAVLYIILGFVLVDYAALGMIGAVVAALIAGFVGGWMVGGMKESAITAAIGGLIGGIVWGLIGMYGYTSAYIPLLGNALVDYVVWGLVLGGIGGAIAGTVKKK